MMMRSVKFLLKVTVLINVCMERVEDETMDELCGQGDQEDQANEQRNAKHFPFCFCSG